MWVFGWHIGRGFEPDTLLRKIVVEEIQLWPEGRVCALTDVHLEVQAARFQPRNVVWFGTTLGFIRLHIFGGIKNSWCKCFLGHVEGFLLRTVHEVWVGEMTPDWRDSRILLLVGNHEQVLVKLGRCSRVRCDPLMQEVIWNIDAYCYSSVWWRFPKYLTNWVS